MKEKIITQRIVLKDKLKGYLVSTLNDKDEIVYGWSLCNDLDDFKKTKLYALHRLYKYKNIDSAQIKLPYEIKDIFNKFVKRSENYFKNKKSNIYFTEARIDQKYLIFDMDHSLFIHKDSKDVNKLFRKIYSSILDLYYKENKKIYEALKILHIDDVLFKQVVDNIAAYYYQPYPKLHEILCEFYRKSVIISYGFPPVMKKLCFEIYQELLDVPIFLNEDHKFENKLEMINFYTSVVLNKKPEDFIVFDDDEKLIQQLKIAGYYTNLIKTGDNFNV